MKVFPNMKWGTRDPVAFKDSELGLVRLRAFGVFNVRVTQPVLFVNKLAGTQAVYRAGDLEEYLRQVVVSRFNDLLGEQLDTLANLPGRYESIAAALERKLGEDFADYGLALSDLYINSITPPQEVQKAIDDKSRLGMFDDLNKLMRMKAAMAMEEAAQSASAGGAAGVGLGLMMPSLFMHAAATGSGTITDGPPCPGCGRPVPSGSKFCPACGHSLLVFDRCSACGANLPPHARFCPACGQAADSRPASRVCPHCRFENLPQATYCNQCGEKLE
jgi:membrane protease subunit (stomatin/prohibitin family)